MKDLSQSQFVVKNFQNIICLGTVHKCDDTDTTLINSWGSLTNLGNFSKKCQPSPLPQFGQVWKKECLGPKWQRLTPGCDPWWSSCKPQRSTCRNHLRPPSGWGWIRQGGWKGWYPSSLSQVPQLWSQAGNLSNMGGGKQSYVWLWFKTNTNKQEHKRRIEDTKWCKMELLTLKASAKAACSL